MTISKSKLLAVAIFFLLFQILHLETISILGIKISYLWKAILLFYLVSQLNRRKIWSGYYSLLALSFISLLNNDLTIDLPTAGINLFNILIIPIIGIYISHFDIERLKRINTRISLFVIVSFIPYSLGIIESLGQAYDLENFGGSFGLVGVFATAHGASLTLAAALLVVVDLYISEKKYKAIYGAALAIGFLFLIQTYVRTGLLMFIVGAFALFMSNAKHIKKLHLALIPAFIFALWLPTTEKFEILTNRITGSGIYTNEDSISSLGSGRGGIYMASLKIFSEFDTKSMLIGVGKATQMDLIESKIGLRIGSHNAFIDLLLAHGIFGLMLFVQFLYKVLMLISKQPQGRAKSLAISLYLAYLAMCLVQGFNWLFVNVIFLLTLTICLKIVTHPKPAQPITRQTIQPYT